VTAPTGTFTAAQYTQSYAYDVLDRLTTGPEGTYTYGDSSHLVAVTSTSSGYTAGYDLGGSMSCRAPTSSQTCSGTPTGQPISYDALERQLTWANAQSNPTVHATYGYDGSGSRVEQQATVSGTTTTTYYIGSYEEVSKTGSTTTTTTKYYDAHLTTAVSVNGTISFLLKDEQGSVMEARMRRV
jgi:hypothetical protein